MAKYFIQNPEGLTFTNPVGGLATFAVEVIIPISLVVIFFIGRILFSLGGKRWLAVAMAYKR